MSGAIPDSIGTRFIDSSTLTMRKSPGIGVE
jgi:hypothetical protein